MSNPLGRPHYLANKSDRSLILPSSASRPSGKENPAQAPTKKTAINKTFNSMAVVDWKSEDCLQRRFFSPFYAFLNVANIMQETKYYISCVIHKKTLLRGKSLVEGVS